MTNRRVGCRFRPGRSPERVGGSKRVVAQRSSPDTTASKKSLCQDLATGACEPYSENPLKEKIMVDCYVAPALAYCHISGVLRRGFEWTDIPVYPASWWR